MEKQGRKDEKPPITLHQQTGSRVSRKWGRFIKPQSPPLASRFLEPSSSLNVHRIFLNSATRCKGGVPTQESIGDISHSSCDSSPPGPPGCNLDGGKRGGAKSRILFLSRTRVVSHEGLTLKISRNPSYLLLGHISKCRLVNESDRQHVNLSELVSSQLQQFREVSLHRLLGGHVTPGRRTLDSKSA